MARPRMARFGLSIAAAAMVLGLTASVAMAGEVTGSGKNADHNQGKSWCSFSGLNDTPDGFPPAGDPGGIAQSYGYFQGQFGIYDSSDPAQRASFLFPANGCNPTVQGGTH